MMGEAREWRQLILDKRDEGEVVVLTVEGLEFTSLDNFIKQPADGILYDLNRLEETALTFLPDPKWVNDFAVALTIRELKSQLEQAEAEREVKEGESAGAYVERRIMDIFQEVAEHVGNEVFDLDHPAPIIRGSIVMTNAWNKYLASLRED